MDDKERIAELERENKALKHKLKYAEKIDKIARKIISMYKKMAREFKYEISEAEFDEWWENPPRNGL